MHQHSILSTLFFSFYFFFFLSVAVVAAISPHFAFPFRDLVRRHRQRIGFLWQVSKSQI